MSNNILCVATCKLAMWSALQTLENLNIWHNELILYWANVTTNTVIKITKFTGVANMVYYTDFINMHWVQLCW